MSPAPVRLYKPTGTDRVAVVSTEPAAGAPGRSFIRLARGPGGPEGAAMKGAIYGPFHDAERDDRLAEVLAALRAEGFGPPGLPALLDALQGPDPAARARAALRLGWRRQAEAVEPILARLPEAVDEVCSLLDALGAVGDPRAVPALRAYAARKLLSRRRSAVEALRALGDDDGLAEAAARALESLPTAVREAVASGAAAQGLAQAVLSLDPPRRGLALDALYEAGVPGAGEAVLLAIEGDAIDRPYLWRYVKSLYKRAMLRHDPALFGGLARAIEVRARASAGTEATVRSGYDGVERPTPIFRRKTQLHARRLGWRYLANLAKHRPSLYAHAAAEAVAAYRTEDPEEPDGLRGAFARCYLWHRVLFGRSARFRLDDRRLIARFRDQQSVKAPPDVREEAWPELWDAQPTAYLRILRSAALPEAHAFACRALKARHPRLLDAASIDDLLGMLRAPYPETVERGLAELGRRFDPARPDLPLLDRVLSDASPEARELGRRWLRLAAPAWTRDQEWVLVFLAFPDAETASLAGALAADALRADPAMRRALAARLLALLRSPEPTPGAHDVYASLAGDAAADEVSALLSIPELLAFCTTGAPPLQALAGRLLARRPEAAAHLGLEGLMSLADHEVASVRAAAHALLRTNGDGFRADPSPLFVLAESDWPDTRGLAFALLRDQAGGPGLGFDGLVGLLDSTRPDVRAFGRSLARSQADRIDHRLLALRMTEHPDPDMRRFALDLAVSHLPDGAEALAGVAWFLHASLLDLRPDRLLKRRVIDFVLARGLREPHQGEVAARLLGEWARMAVRSDAEHALEAIARLALAWPGLRLPEGVAAAATGGGAP